MNWIHLFGSVMVNLNQFVFYDIKEDGSSVFIAPNGQEFPLESEQHKEIQRLFQGNPDPPHWFDHTIRGLAWPNGSDGPWVEIETGAVNMALVDTVTKREEGRIVILWAGGTSRMYSDANAELIWRWLTTFGERVSVFGERMPCQ